MTYARAGHTPLLYLPGGATLADRRVQMLAPDGLVLGLKIDDGEMFEQPAGSRRCRSSTGDVCLFFTDGISEAMNSGGRLLRRAAAGQLIEEHAPPAVATSCASAMLRESQRSSATRRSTTT